MAGSSSSPGQVQPSNRLLSTFLSSLHACQVNFQGCQLFSTFIAPPSGWDSQHQWHNSLFIITLSSWATRFIACLNTGARFFGCQGCHQRLLINQHLSITACLSPSLGSPGLLSLLANINCRLQSSLTQSANNRHVNCHQPHHLIVHHRLNILPPPIGFQSSPRLTVTISRNQSKATTSSIGSNTVSNKGQSQRR